MQIHYQKDGPTGWITLDNPPRNSLDHPVFADRAELAAFFNEPQLKQVIIKGNGRHFCDGADLRRLADLAQKPLLLKQALNQGKELLDIISTATIPVAALISGSCLGGGLELALSCHFRFAANSAMFGFPETDHQLMPGQGGTLYAGELIHHHHLIDLILSARLIGANEAKELGMIHDTAPARTVQDRLLDFLHRLTDKRTPEQIRAVMRSIHNGRLLPPREALQEETRLFCQLAAKRDRDTT